MRGSGAAGSRRPLLILHTNLQPGGSQRYAYELARAFRRRGHPVDFVTHKAIDESHVFYPRLLELGVRVHPVVTWPACTEPPPTTRRAWPWRRGASPDRDGRHVSAWVRFLARAPIVIVFQIENFYHMREALEPLSNVALHLVSHQYQYDFDLYADFPRDSRVRVITQDQEQRDEFVASCGGVERLITVPLGLDFSPFEPIEIDFEGRLARRPARVGVFIRISRERPVGPLFEALARINASSRCELYHYGGYGRPEEFEGAIARLGIGERVHFRGHSHDMRRSLIEDEIDYVWMTSIGDSVGYASLELAAYGMPILFWSESRRSTAQVLEATGGALHAFNHVDDFVRAHFELVGDPGRMKTLAADLRRFLVDRHSIEGSLERLAEFYAVA